MTLLVVTIAVTAAHTGSPDRVIQALEPQRFSLERGWTGQLFTEALSLDSEESRSRQHVTAAVARGPSKELIDSSWDGISVIASGTLLPSLTSTWPVGDRQAQLDPCVHARMAAVGTDSARCAVWAQYSIFAIQVSGTARGLQFEPEVRARTEGIARQALSNFMEDDSLEAEDRSFMGREMDVRVGPRGVEVVPLEDWAAVAGATVAHDPVVQSWTLTKGEQVWEFRLAADCLEAGGRRTAMGGFLVRIGGRPYAPIAALAAHVR